MRRAAAAVLTLAAVAACERKAPPAGTPEPPATRSLLTALGPSGFVRVRDETRPAALLRPGEARSCALAAGPGRRLSFAWTVGPKAPAQGFVELRVSAGSQTLYRTSFALPRRHRWWPVSLELPETEPVMLVFRGEHLRAGGGPMEPGAAPDDPWIAIGSPRIEGPAQPPRRTLVWISQDAVRADHLSVYGYRRATTPWFDREARAWVIFDHAVSAAPWTLPSLASQFTSRYPLFHGAAGEDRTLDPALPTVFERLGAAGFTVLGVTANDFVSAYFGMARGFDALYFTGGNQGPEGRQRADELNRLALRALDERRAGDLALFVHYMDPHYPYDPPPPFDQAFADAAPPSRAERDRARAEARYDGEIAYTDTQIGALLRELDARGLLERAVLVYTADHGEEFLDHGGWRHSRTLYREMLHVPLALRVPGVAGRRVPETVSLVDLAPTLLDAFGLPAPAAFQGRTLLPRMRGGALAPREVFAETERNPDRAHRLAVQLGRVKYILRTRAGDPTKPLSEELYDLAADPEERRSDLTRPEAERLRRQAADYLRRGRTGGGAPGAAEIPPELRDRLRALGYLK